MLRLSYEGASFGGGLGDTWRMVVSDGVAVEALLVSLLGINLDLDDDDDNVVVVVVVRVMVSCSSETDDGTLDEDNEEEEEGEANEDVNRAQRDLGTTCCC